MPALTADAFASLSFATEFICRLFVWVEIRLVHIIVLSLTNVFLHSAAILLGVATQN